MKLTKQQVIAIVTPFITLAAGYLGFEPIQQLKSPPSTDVNIEVIAPGSSEHTHQQHNHRDWLPVIQHEIEKAKRVHIKEHH